MPSLCNRSVAAAPSSATSRIAAAPSGIRVAQEISGALADVHQGIQDAQATYELAASLRIRDRAILAHVERDVGLVEALRSLICRSADPGNVCRGAKALA